jgi:hypothetical protein
MQLPGGSINTFFPGHLDSNRPELSGYSAFSAAIVSPFLETPSGFFQADDCSLTTYHGSSTHRIPGSRMTLTAIDGTFHAGLPKTHGDRRQQLHCLLEMGLRILSTCRAAVRAVSKVLKMAYQAGDICGPRPL